MKITYLVLNRDIAGGEVVCLQQMRAARNRGHEVCLLVPSHGTMAEHATKEGFQTFTISLARTFQLHRALMLGAWLKRHKVELLHTHTMVSGMILARLAAKLAGVPMVSHIHAPNVYSQRKIIRLIQVALDRLTMPFCDAYIMVSADTYRRFTEQIILSNAYIVPNGVQEVCEDSETSGGEIRSRWGIAAGTHLIGCIGRLEHNKGQHDLIEAFAKVVSVSDKKIALVMIGEDISLLGQYRQKLQQSAVNLKIEQKSIFTGFQPNAASLMCELNIVVLPSYREAMPMTILEAMAAGKPVVATNVNGIPEVVEDGITGILIPPGDVNALAEAIVRLLATPDLARRMGEDGRQRVRNHFSLEQQLDSVFAIYDEVMTKRRG